MPANGGTCHQRSKTPVPPGSNAIASITYDDLLETKQIPTSVETHHQWQYLSEGNVRPMTSQAALISLDAKHLPDHQVQQVPHSRTFSRDEDYMVKAYGSSLDLEQQCQQQQKPQSSPSQYQSNPSSVMQPRRTSCFSGSQPSLSTLAAFVTGTNSLHHPPGKFECTNCDCYCRTHCLHVDESAS